MRTAPQGHRIAVVGATSLLGKELVNVLEERHFPFSCLVTLSDEETEPELPILDLREGPETAVAETKVSAAEFDFAFIATSCSQGLSFLNLPPALEPGAPGCFTIDLSSAALGDATAEPPAFFPQRVARIPFLDGSFPQAEAKENLGGRVYVSASPATIVISTLLLRLGARFPLRSALAHIFVSASEIGSRGIEELQKQTVNLLSFQKIPSRVFGTQLAFNLLWRPGGTGGSDLRALESHLRQQLKGYLRGRVPLPPLRLVQVPLFHSLAVSLFVETSQPVPVEELGEALQGERVQVRRRSQNSPTPVEVAGSDKILVDSVTAALDHPAGFWIWAVADNLCLAAVNAVEIAESLRPERQLRS